MNVEFTEAQWLYEQSEVSIEELAELSGLSSALLRELVDYGALVPSDTRSTQLSFAANCVVTVRTASRLREDFDLDTNALSVALALVERIRGLEEQLRELRTQFPRLRRTG